MVGLIDPSRNRDSSDFGNVNRGKRTTNLLSFPLDIQNTDLVQEVIMVITLCFLLINKQIVH